MLVSGLNLLMNCCFYSSLTFSLKLIFNYLSVNLQIYEEAKKFSYQTGVRVVVAYGGAPMVHQVLLLVVEFFYCCSLYFFSVEVKIKMNVIFGFICEFGLQVFVSGILTVYFFVCLF